MESIQLTAAAVSDLYNLIYHSELDMDYSFIFQLPFHSSTFIPLIPLLCIHGLCMPLCLVLRHCSRQDLVSLTCICFIQFLHDIGMAWHGHGHGCVCACACMAGCGMHAWHGRLWEWVYSFSSCSLSRPLCLCIEALDRTGHVRHGMAWRAGMRQDIPSPDPLPLPLLSLLFSFKSLLGGGGIFLCKVVCKTSCLIPDPQDPDQIQEYTGHYTLHTHPYHLNRQTDSQ